MFRLASIRALSPCGGDRRRAYRCVVGEHRKCMNSRRPFEGGPRQSILASRRLLLCVHWHLTTQIAHSVTALRSRSLSNLCLGARTWRSSPTAQRSPVELIALKRGGAAACAWFWFDTKASLRGRGRLSRAATIRTRTSSAGNVAQRKFVTGGVEYLSVLYDEKSWFARRFGRTQRWDWCAKSQPMNAAPLSTTTR